LWSKVLGGNPDAELDGFPMPTALPSKLVMKGETTSDEGGALYTANKGNAEWDEAVKAFQWWNSPEIVKLRAEAIGFVPAMDVEYELETPQYVKFIKPFLDGKFGPVKFDGSLGGEISVGGKKKSGKPRVWEDNAVVPIIGDYLSGKTSMADFMDRLQARYEASY
jgi:hypothetical protein